MFNTQFDCHLNKIKVVQLNLLACVCVSILSEHKCSLMSPIYYIKYIRIKNTFQNKKVNQFFDNSEKRCKNIVSESCRRGEEGMRLWRKHFEGAKKFV